MRSYPKCFCPVQSCEWDRRRMRRPTKYSAGSPHLYERIFTWTYCACANTQKNPQPPRITGNQEKTRFIGNKNHFFGLMFSREVLFTAGTCVTSY